ncbi:MAG: hypothetical protein KKI06_04375 [Euryarchaeota archaeon]|nr:hypothetical protein [Euryarchaeota archaeon]MBU4220646.1 hypothetical protein [Euryarchaeota archaeon]MCG2735779.1 hypothetical protein [Candidatus Methanoperedenaceae archaeon]
MKLKGLKKRLNALKPLEKIKEPPQWCYEYGNSVTIERWKTIGEALIQYKQGITVNTEVLGYDRAFYERVIEAGREGIIEL